MWYNIIFASWAKFRIGLSPSWLNAATPQKRIHTYKLNTIIMLKYIYWVNIYSIFYTSFSLDLLIFVLIFLVFVLPLLLPLLLPRHGLRDVEDGAGHLDTDLTPDLPVPPVGLGLPLLLTLGQALTEKGDAVGSLGNWKIRLGSSATMALLPLAGVMEQAGNWPYKHQRKVLSRILGC